MYAQAASNATEKNGLVGLANCGALRRQGTNLLVFKAPGENLFVEGHEEQRLLAPHVGGNGNHD
jgi:hypothetical protein